MTERHRVRDVALSGYVEKLSQQNNLYILKPRFSVREARKIGFKQFLQFHKVKCWTTLMVYWPLRPSWFLAVAPSPFLGPMMQEASRASTPISVSSGNRFTFFFSWSDFMLDASPVNNYSVWANFFPDSKQTLVVAGLTSRVKVRQYTLLIQESYASGLHKNNLGLYSQSL